MQRFEFQHRLFIVVSLRSCLCLCVCVFLIAAFASSVGKTFDWHLKQNKQAIGGYCIFTSIAWHKLPHGNASPRMSSTFVGVDPAKDESNHQSRLGLDVRSFLSLQRDHGGLVLVTLFGNDFSQVYIGRLGRHESRAHAADCCNF